MAANPAGNGRAAERHWRRGCTYLQQGLLAPAGIELESLRAAAPDDARTHLLAAQVAWHGGHPRDAARHALAAAAATPADPLLRCEVIDTLLHVGESAAAHALLCHPAWPDGSPDAALLRRADFHQGFGEHIEALATLDRLLARHPGDGRLRGFRAQELEFLGRLDAAQDAYAASLAAAPGNGRAAYRLARSRRREPDADLLATIESGLRHVPVGSRGHADFEFARYHALEALGRDHAAWQALADANAIMHRHVGADAGWQQQGLQQFREFVATRPLPRAADQPAGPRPIFIVGLPRSGSTLLERMLTNHSQVAGAGELVDFGLQLLRAANTSSQYSAAFRGQWPTLDLADVGRGYLVQAGWRAGDKPWFVDKQPANWIVAGLLHAALPAARILHIARDPTDVCFSNWRARFGDAYPWSYDFATLAAHYGEYVRLMRHWHAACPGAILDVDYADLVHAPAATVRRVLDFCGLPWEAGCEDLTRNAAPVSTLSAAAVREPVHTRALGAWRRYAAQLEPLRQRLPPGA